MGFFKKKLKMFGTKRAQHTIEYITLLTLIMAGIIIMGRYVVRSWNANLQGWEDSTLDSIQDPFIDIPAAIGGCDPGPWVSLGCGLGRNDDCTGTIFSCTPQEQLDTRAFTPFNCQCAIIPAPPITSKCDVDQRCCTIPVKTGLCGVNATLMGLPLPAGNNSGMTPKFASGSCPDAMMEAWTLCGSDVNPTGRRYGCLNDGACIFNCQTPPFPGFGPQYDAMCPGDTTKLSSDFIHYSFVNFGSCTAVKKCEQQCAPGFVAKGGGLYCECPVGYVKVGSTCVCPAGQVEQGSCAPGCEQGTCGANQCTNSF